MNQTDDARFNKYNLLSQQFTKYIGTSLYAVCVFGTMMNILTFLQRKYTYRACSIYLLLASTCDFIQLNIGPLSNILHHGFHYDWTITSIGYCKTKSYLVYILTISSATLTTLASINQFMLSSKKSSRWYYSSRSIGIRNSILTISFWTIFSIPFIFCFKRYPRLSNDEQLICSNPCRSFPCRLVHVMYTCLFNGFLPPLIMMFFGFLTHRNVRHLRQRSKLQFTRIQKINHQLTRMLVLQSIKSTFASLPYAIFNCYWIETIYQEKSLGHQAIDGLINQIVYLFFWSNYTSFFVYIYSSDIFRRQWIKMMKKTICCGRREKKRATSL